MKTILIILCAFLLKAESGAQVWLQISPKYLSLNKVIFIKDTLTQLHIFALEKYALHHSIHPANTDTIKWDISGTALGGGCVVEYTPHNTRFEQYMFTYRDVIPLDKNIILVWIGPDECPKDVRVKTNYFFYDKAPRFQLALDTFKIFKTYTRANDSTLETWFIQYSLKNNLYYSLQQGKLNVYNTDKELLLSSVLPSYQQTPYPQNEILKVDPRMYSKLYYSFENGGCFVTDNNGQQWQIASPVIDSLSKNETKILDVLFPPTQQNIILINTTSGLWSYNDSSKKSELITNLLFKTIYFKENSNIAYAGTKSGEIYRSTDAGETWSLFASGFSTKPVIGIYASGNDSLIVGTEDGIWANYALPVSVAEDIPFKKAELSITPNPANTSLKISFLKTELPQQLSIYNSLGQLVFKTEFSGEFVWDFKSDIPDGIYTVAVQSGGNSVAKQVVILR